MEDKYRAASVSHGATTRAFLNRIYPFFKPYLIQSATAWLALFFAHIVEAVIPIYLKDGIDAISRQESSVTSQANAILWLAVLRFLVLNHGRRRNALISIELASTLRLTCYRRLLTLDRFYYANNALGDIMARVTNDIAAIQRFFFRIAVHQWLSLISIALIAPAFMFRQSLESLSFVIQDRFLFTATISENISFDDPNRPPDTIWAAAAQIAETIAGFNAGLATLVGERGVTLSGGQKQRAGLTPRWSVIWPCRWLRPPPAPRRGLTAA